MKQRFCMYCSRFRPDHAFKTVLHHQTGSKRGMCPSCQEVRKLPRDVLQEKARIASIERNRK